MTFMTFQERACILEIHGLNLKGREVGGTTLHPNKEKDLFPLVGTDMIPQCVGQVTEILIG